MGRRFSAPSSPLVVALLAVTLCASLSGAYRTALTLKQTPAEVGLHGSIAKAGEVFIEIHIGSRKFDVQVDTGSADLGVPMMGCRGCPKKNDAPYDPDGTGAAPVTCAWCKEHANNGTSSSCTGQRCQFEISYDDGSGFTAELFQDNVTLGSLDSGLSATAIVGAISKMNEKMNPPTIDGIIGFAYGSQCSSAGASTPYELMVRDGSIEKDVFAMCIQYEGGAMYFGEDAAAVATGAEAQGTIAYTPLVAGTGFYTIEMRGLRVGGVALPVDPSVFNAGGCIVDSGSTDLTIPAPAFKALRKAFGALCRNGTLAGDLVGLCTKAGGVRSNGLFDGSCFAMTSTQRSSFPPLQFDFAGGVTIDVPAVSYLRQGPMFCDTAGAPNGHYGLAIESGDEADGTILGDTIMQSVVSVFDRAGSRMGFTPLALGASCP